MTVTIAGIERATLGAWPAIEVVSDGQWQARFANGYTKRANSIHCMDPDDDGNPAARLSALADLYRQHDLPPVFRVTPLTGTATCATLDRLGWAVSEPSLVLDMEIGRTNGIDGAIGIFAPTDTAFLAVQNSLQGLDEIQSQAFAAIIGQMRAASAGLVLSDTEGNPVASAICAEVGGIGVFVNVVTAEAARRRGYARRLMESAISWVAENGAQHAAIQVLAANSPALSLYLSLGFSYRYPYHYRRRAGEAAR